MKLIVIYTVWFCFCRYIEGKVMPCIKTKTEACKYSHDLVLVQSLMIDYFDGLKDQFDDCEPQANLLLDDVTRPEAECSVQFFLALKQSMPKYTDFNMALCDALTASAACEVTQTVPYIVKVFDREHENFYEDFWLKHCEGRDMDGGGEGTDTAVLPGKKTQHVLFYFTRPNCKILNISNFADNVSCFL